MAIETDRNGIPWMRHLIPEGAQGTARVSHFEITEDAARWENMRYSINRQLWLMRIEAGQYVRLHADGDLQMSDTQMERRTNCDILRDANGNVLIGGLGIGMLPATLLMVERRPGREVRSVTIVERNPDVIALVEPHIRDPRLTVIEGDVFDWKPEKGQRFDAIYMDIWPGMSTDNLDDMARLHRRFSPYVNRENPLALLTSWLVDHLRRERRSDSRTRWY